MKRFKSIGMYVGLLVMATFVLGVNAYAGTGGSTEFGALYTLISGWTSGVLGKALAICAFLIGMGMSIVQQSLMPVALGIGAAAAFAYTPTIMDGIITATIL